MYIMHAIQSERNLICPNFTLQQDKNPEHTARVTADGLFWSETDGPAATDHGVGLGSHESEDT